MPGAFLLLIVLFGVCLRFYGLDWGTDLDGRFHPLHPDETTLINAASQLRESLKPSVTAYGTLPMYLLYVVGKPAAVFGGRALFEPDHQAFTHAIARTLSASFSVLAIWFAFKIGTRTDDDRVGLLAAAFLAVMVLPIQLAHFYTVDGIFAALAALALYRSIKAEQGRDCWRDHILIGIFTGLAASVRLGGILLLAPLVAIRLRHLLSGGRKARLWRRVATAGFADVRSTERRLGRGAGDSRFTAALHGPGAGRLLACKGRRRSDDQRRHRPWRNCPDLDPL